MIFKQKKSAGHLEYPEKIHGASAFTAFTPLLNLNLNYEKLQMQR